jgi:ABC-2 type transport system permease protein
VAWSLPSSHVFEGMRAVMFEGVLHGELLVHALVLNALWLAVGGAAFLAAFRIARRDGLLLHFGE